MSEMAGERTETWTNLPRYRDMFRAKFASSTVQFRGAGAIGATVMRHRQPPGNWSSDPTSDLMVSLTYTTGARFNLAVSDVRFRETQTTQPGFVVVAPGTDTEFVSYDTLDTLSVAIPYQRMAGFFGDEELPAASDFGALHGAGLDEPGIIQRIEKMWQLGARSDGASGLETDGNLLLLTAGLARLVGARRRPASGGLSGWQMRQCRELMESSAENVLSLNELAAAVRLSPYHFCRAFKDSFGMPPYRYQTLLRLNRARRMLADTGQSVTDIALAVGYESGQALARAFRRELGVSPQAYRRQL